eukprot:7861059-Alexandrium_andersonii.AAC.1
MPSCGSPWPPPLGWSAAPRRRPRGSSGWTSSSRGSWARPSGPSPLRECQAAKGVRVRHCP